MGPLNILQPLLEQATLEEQSLGAPTKKTLLEIAEKLVRWAPNLYSSCSNPGYSDEEKGAAKALLLKYGLRCKPFSFPSSNTATNSINYPDALSIG